MTGGQMRQVIRNVVRSLRHARDEVVVTGAGWIGLDALAIAVRGCEDAPTLLKLLWQRTSEGQQPGSEADMAIIVEIANREEEAAGHRNFCAAPREVRSIWELAHLAETGEPEGSATT